MNGKGKGNTYEWAQTKVGGGSGIVKKNRNKWGVENNKERRNVAYLAIGYKVATPFIIIFKMCRREGV